MGDQRFIMWKKKWFYVVDLKKNDFYYIYILHSWRENRQHIKFYFFGKIKESIKLLYRNIFETLLSPKIKIFNFYFW